MPNDSFGLVSINRNHYQIVRFQYYSANHLMVSVLADIHFIHQR